MGNSINCMRGELQGCNQEREPLIGSDANRNQEVTESLALRNGERVDQEGDERGDSAILVSEFCKSHEDKYELTGKMSDLGCRLQKYWFEGVSRRLKSDILITIAPISRNCPLTLTNDHVNELNERILPVISEHSCVHPILGIHRVSDSHVIVIQQLATRGSLRDLLYETNFELDWSMKYSVKRTVLKGKEVALYGRQILEAVLFLYEQGFPALGHIHVGNIFVSEHDGCCTLGGIDNSLLGYKSSVHSYLGEMELAGMDIIMFGRVIFEMSSKAELLEMIPDQHDLQTVTDKNVKKVLESIFQMDDEGKLANSMKEIMMLPFFQDVLYSPSSCEAKLGDDPRIREILEASSPRKQPKMKQPKKSTKDVSVKLNAIMKKLGYTFDTDDFLEIGWRVGKHWKLVSTHGNSDTRLMSFIKVSKTCPIFLTHSAVTTINGFLEQRCEVLHPIHEVKFCSKYVTTTQPLKRASLKDVIFKTDRLEDWPEKLKHQGKPLKRKQIFLFSKQILQAVLALNRAGFPPLGSIQTGNIFVDGNVCRLGGYENTLLGYRSHEKFSGHLEAIDVVMFGHVMYEMGSGRELVAMTPSEEEYSRVRDRDTRLLLEGWIFKMEDGKIVNTIEEIYDKIVSSEKMKDSEIPSLVVSEDMEKLLSKVRKGKARKNKTLPLLKAVAGKTLKTLL